mmetsp:Transcript_5926/g.8973  ORF Transcript_5926/g.8973 Transcript_5926/m.8973 type:complete len:150 (+) Transcript_5926:76-525(+)|eukprot:CAMPEP_0117024876 /NCGR_PEP_ID=MMETSP0472-20121206/18433_1 /TAXON_ID=693140 ORGANISM="Tiarina fusus, Strain LIS" /NCGR_SAMPLE_ID=MMETSP0472 /ASSEMBLY_ACC=CAM_ASM_000603 /LENGTH=149 /DNA_ID=CAMNT_0004731437 /DNA_START=89 /DNA_END=538 /DNA_ORIENTATION=+
MSSAPGNIFLTTENLAFSMPLLIVCGSYAYFKYVPLKIGLPILLGLFVVYQIRAQIIAQHGKKLQNMDEKAINDLALELEGDKNGEEETEKAKKLQKKKEYAVQQRLAAEQKKEAKQSKQKNKKGGNDDDDDDALLETFAKGGKAKKTK